MRDSGGRGQGPGRSSGGAGSPGGSGAVRRGPGGPGRSGRPGATGGAARSEGAGRPGPEEPPRRRPTPPDPIDLPRFEPPRSRDRRNPADRRPADETDSVRRGRQGRDDETDPVRRGRQGRDDETDPVRRGRQGRDEETDSVRRGRQGRDDDGDGARRGRFDDDETDEAPPSRGSRSRSADEGRNRSARRGPAGRDGESSAPGLGVPRPRGASQQREGVRRPGPPGRKPPPPRPPQPPRPPMVLRLGNPRRRIKIGVIAMAFILSIFAGRLIQMQGLDSKVYEAAGAANRVRTEDIPAKRGTIADVNGNPLALTVEAREISLDPSKIVPAKRPEVAKKLAAALGVPEADIMAKLAKTTTRYQRIAKDIEPLVADAVLKLDLPTVSAKKHYKRMYPAKELAGSVIGFVGSDGAGLSGLEAAKNTLLAGQDGTQRVEIGRDGQRIPMTSSQRKPSVDGRDIRLTIDRDIQWAAQKAIAEQVAATKADSGTVIVMSVKDAHVLAMANAPEVDLSNWGRAPSSLYVNRAAAEVFEPGSTNKVITAAAALESGVMRPDTTLTVADKIKCFDKVLRDSHPHPTEKMTFQKAMSQSSNTAVVQAARKIGNERLHAMLKAFGFGSRPGGGIPGEEAGILPDHQKWSGSQSCTIAYGQGVSVTALQMASVYQTIANGGVRIEPQLIAGQTDESGAFVPAAPGQQTRVVSDATAKQLTGMLEGAVGAEGTGQAAAIPGYRVAGKTGTANRYDAAIGDYKGYTASFVGFSPADAPQLVVLSVLQNPTVGHFGGQIAAPVFKDVMTFAIKSKKIPPSGATRAAG
ncbi:penicillin-binding transpeptidase domain-containing protein [Nonomuraea sp. NPDC050663]|uniref:penicillin-binding transpeptidase domain-containing protein n=1 Tax=Nonomuraea sp. NPDC050663 TaxID=3364370 RepID=UPI0037BD71A4